MFHSNLSMDEIFREVKRIKLFARCHLSNFQVGAAIVTKDGSVFLGCNIEFDNYSNTIHAEESAISAYISSGNKSPIDYVFVYTSAKDLAWPCGMCRQSLFELGGPYIGIYAANDHDMQYKIMEDLLPNGFKL